MGAALAAMVGVSGEEKELNFLRFGERTFLGLFGLINIPFGKISGSHARAGPVFKATSLTFPFNAVHTRARGRSITSYADHKNSHLKSLDTPTTLRYTYGKLSHFP